MSLVDSTAADRLVWTGRFPEAWPGGLDSWNSSRQVLAARLDRLPELVVLDAPSFPWPMLNAERRPMPLTVRLPADLDATTIGDLLGGPLLSRVTPYDRLVETRPDVRRRLEDEWGLAPVVWADEVERTAADLEQVRAAKPAFVQVDQLMVQQLLASLAEADPDDERASDLVEKAEAKPWVALGGATQQRRRALEFAAGVEVMLLEEVHEHDPDVVSPDAVVLLLDDGGQSSADRLALLRLAHHWLPPGGVLLVVGHVVTSPGGAANPSVSALVEEIHDATGSAVHLQELQAVRWVGDDLTRGVVLRFVSLRRSDP